MLGSRFLCGLGGVFSIRRSVSFVRSIFSDSERGFSFMPQPLPPHKKIHFHFHPLGILERPDLAAHIGAISGLWNDIETRMNIFLASLLGDEAETVIAVFQSIQNDGARRAAADAICSLKLDPTEREAYQEAQRLVGARYADRNSIVHGAWGISDTYPDSLLWMDVRDSTTQAVLLMKLQGPTHTEERKRVQAKFQRKILRYEKRDFEEIESRINDAYAKLLAFTKPYLERAFAGNALIDVPPNRPLRG